MAGTSYRPSDEEFDRWRVNAHFIRETELGISQEKLIDEIIDKNPNLSTEQLKKVLGGGRPSSDPTLLIEKIAAALANSTSAPASATAQLYLTRIKQHCYPEILDDSKRIREWLALSRENFASELNDHAGAYSFPWQPLDPDRFYLTYDPSRPYDRRNLPDYIQRAISTWTSGNPKVDEELKDQPDGPSVCISTLGYSHRDNRDYSYRATLVPVPFWYYAAAHQSLAKSDLPHRRLRQLVWRNALDDLVQQQECLLPTHFCLHMGIISADKHVMIRKRRPDQTFFPNAWECSIGEFMHGRETKDDRFRAFDHNGQPGMLQFCKAAVAEETRVSIDANDDGFTLLGFSIEYISLAPKLVVLYKSHLDHRVLVKSMPKAVDPSLAAEGVPLIVQEVAKVIKAGRFWTPTSKLCMWLALKSQFEEEEEWQAANAELDRLLLEPA